MSKDDHFLKVMDHLNNMLLYKELGDDPSELFLEKSTLVLAGMIEMEPLDRDTFDFCQP